MKYDAALMYTCSLIEFIGRQQRLPRAAVTDALGKERLSAIYRHADVLHCETIESVAHRFITEASVPSGTFDNVGRCRYAVPDYWDIGEVYSRLIEDVAGNDTLETLWAVYHSWIDAAISNYNSDFFYQSRDYIRACYLAGEVLAG